MDDAPIILAGSSHPVLAQQIAAAQGGVLGEVTIKRFACSEVYVRLDSNVRGRDVVIVQSPHTSIDEHIWELLAMVDAAKAASAGTITALLPCLPYARQDKTGNSRESITPRLLATVLEAAGVSHVITMDLHAGQLQAAFRIPCDHLTAEQLILRQLRSENVGGEGWAVAAPDAGRVKLARRYAQSLNSPLVVMSKERPVHNEAEITRVIGSDLVAGRKLLVIDDLIDTAGTLCAAARTLLDHGATQVHAAGTHPVLSDPASQRLGDDSPLTSLWVCDTLPTDHLDIARLKVIPTAGLWAQALERIHSGASLSELFDGSNQQF